MKLKLKNQALVLLLQEEYLKRTLMSIHETTSKTSSAQQEVKTTKIHTGQTNIEGQITEKAKAVHITQPI